MRASYFGLSGILAENGLLEKRIGALPFIKFGPEALDGSQLAIKVSSLRHFRAVWRRSGARSDRKLPACPPVDSAGSLLPPPSPSSVLYPVPRLCGAAVAPCLAVGAVDWKILPGHCCDEFIVDAAAGHKSSYLRSGS